MAVFLSEKENRNLYIRTRRTKTKINNSDFGKIFSKAIDKSGQRVYNDTVMLADGRSIR